MAKKVNPFYRTKKWQRKRERILKHYNYLCQESKQYGYHDQAQTIHHIYPVDEYPDLALIDWNLLPVTTAKHNTFHDRNNDGIVGRGIYWQNKRKREFEKHYENKVQDR